MSDKKKSKRRKDEYTGPGGSENPADETPPKDEFKVAKWMKKNLPTKKTKFLNHNVEYFTASKALDALMTTSFAQGDNALFTSREAAIEYLDSMLVHKFFHRAKKVPVSEAELRRGKKVKDDKESVAVEKTAGDEDQQLRKRNLSKGSSATAGSGKTSEKESSEVDVSKSPKASSSHAEKPDGGEKKKRKIRLDMHPDQVFVDGAEAYVWIYDPIPAYYWLFGALLVVGAIVVCLFPLWPPILRKGVYYLSIAAAGFLVFILSLAVIRFIVFCIVWVLTGSKHHFWLFPNLTEDVGFFASFWPLYQHDYMDANKPKEKKTSKRQKKEKNSDAEEESPLLSNKVDPAVSSGVEDIPVVDESEKTISSDHVRHSDSESESSQKSSTSKDFEMVDADEVPTESS